MSLADLRAALDAELAATPAFYDFKVAGWTVDGGLWRVTLAPDHVYADGLRPGQASAQALLDDSLDGASAWWGAPARGWAQVLAVSAEDDQLLLRPGGGAPPPGPDHLIRVYPARFLHAVAAAWDDARWAPRALAAFADLSRPRRVDDGPPLTGEPFRWLRPAQRAALGGVHWSSAFLWGPPGTGKTTTLGVLVAEYLDRRPDARVLLLSTTNVAVDQATVAVDKALEKGRRGHLREAVRRLGSRVTASAYLGREHLLPTDDDDLVPQLARLEATRPSPQDAAALAAWGDRVAALRERLRAASLHELRRCRLACMTTARAVGTLQVLRELSAADDPPFDLVVFDEASQASLAQVLALMPLGRARLFAGDPQQLSPVLRSTDRGARRWLGRSAFGEMPRQGPAVTLLDEQSRMAPPIGDLVSHLFYDGRLRVADDARASPGWLAARRRAFGALAADTHLHVHPVRTDGAWSAGDRGPVRRESADAIAAMVTDALAGGVWQPHELIVLTPFRAQRALIRRRLDALGVPEAVRVSTVHRAQGSEAPVVLFDPVDGSQPFLRTDEAARLVDVAFSRAQAKLVVFLSPGDRTNPLLAPVAQRLRLAGDARPVVPLQDLARAADFPANALGLRVAAGRHVGEVVRIGPDGRQFWLVDERSGAERPIDAAFWRARAAAPADAFGTSATSATSGVPRTAAP